MQGLEVVTYQASKNGGGASGDTQDIINRLDKLENQQTNIYNEFFCDFKDSKYIDEYKTTALFNNDGIVPRQFKENYLINFSKNDDDIDYDKSTNMAWVNKTSMQFDKDIVTDGELCLFPIKVNNAVGFKLDSSYILPSKVSGIAEREIDSGSKWTAHGVDNYGRLWVFSKKGYTNLAADKIKLIIYNKDMTIYDQKEINNFLFIANNYLPITESTTIAFNDENVCFLALTERLVNTNSEYSIFACYDYILNEGKIIHNSSILSWNLHTTIPRGNIYIVSNIVFFSNLGPSDTYAALFVHDVIINFKSIDEISIIYTNSSATGYSHNMFQYKSNIFRYNNKFYYLSKKWSWDYQSNESLPFSGAEVYEFTVNDDETKVSAKTLAMSGAVTDIFTSARSLTASVVFAYKGYLYNFYNNSSKNLIVRKYKYEITNTTFSITKEIERVYTLSTSAGVINGVYSKPVAIIDNNVINFFYDTKKSDADAKRCTKYMSFDLDLINIIQETILYETASSYLYFDVLKFNDKLHLVEDYNTDNVYTVNDAKNVCNLIKINNVSSTLKYYYYDDVRRSWTNINSGDEVIFGYDTPVNEITIKAILESQTYSASPVIKSINIQSWNNSDAKFRQSEFYSSKIDTVQNDGKGVLTADYENNDGTIDWYVSFDGGINYSRTELGEEFVYTHISAPDFRIKAVLSVTDNAKVLPVVHSYTLKTNHVVLHSDLEEVQINLMKTNFKIDTYTNASKNGLMKMTIDTLSDDKFVDTANSDYIYYPTYGYAGGNYIQTKPEVVDSKVTTLLLTTDETLNADDPNCKILYYASVDGGITFTQINPNIKTQIINTNSGISTIVFKAVFYEGAKLSAWGWAWN